MPRPTKHEHERRKSRTVRYTDAEWSELTGEAELAGLRTSEFVREASLGARVVAAYGPKPSDPQLIGALNRLNLQIASIGNLVNQVARYAHIHEQAPPEWDPDWSHLPGDIDRLKAEAEAALETLVKAHVR